MIYILVFLSAILNGVAQVFWRIGLDGFDFKFGIFNIITAFIKNYNFLIGTFLYIFSILIWFIVLSRVEVSKAYPLLAFSYIVILILGYFLGENVNIYRIIGVFFIVVGMFFIIKS